MRRRDAINERDHLRQVASQKLDLGPHAHLRHRAIPDTTTPTNVLLKFWTGASLTILLVLLGLALLLDLGPVWQVTVGAVLIVTAVEVLLRGRLLLYLLGALMTASAVALTWLVLTNLRQAVGVLALVAAAALGLANLRTLLDRR